MDRSMSNRDGLGKGRNGTGFGGKLQCHLASHWFSKIQDTKNKVQAGRRRGRRAASLATADLQSALARQTNAIDTLSCRQTYLVTDMLPEKKGRS